MYNNNNAYAKDTRVSNLSRYGTCVGGVSREGEHDMYLYLFIDQITIVIIIIINRHDSRTTRVECMI